MKNILFLSIILAFCPGFVNAQADIVPKPRSLRFTRGLAFELDLKTKIVANSNPTRNAASFLNDYLLKFHGFKLETTSKTPKDNYITFEWNGGAGAEQSEAYGISITNKRIAITSLNERGFFYGLQSFVQLLPTDFKGKTRIAAMEIDDAPRFKYRGMHLDVGRHFFPVSFIKKYIDLMAHYKLNYFHWHLTEDQGWRIEIKKYPKLTEIGSKRKETMKEKNFQPYIGDGQPYGGYYTQEQVKEVVAYAKAKFITVVPEIELPGHSSAALAAYPEFGCKENYNYQTQTTWGIFKEVFCPKEETFKFLEDVLSEVASLFPDSPYIHIGGDEVLKDHWKESAFVQDLMKREGLKDEHEVQSYFIRRIEKFVNSKGKRIIGWDEILEGGLAPNAVVMSWRGEKGGIAAAKARHDVVMTPTSHMYFDYGQGDPAFEPLNIGGYLPLQQVYSYDPVPKELSPDEAGFILGAQGNVWTEYLKTPELVEYMAFPRMLALSEVVWSPLEQKNFDDFKERLPRQFSHLDKLGVNYRIPAPEGLANVVLDETNGTARIELKSSLKDSKIYYTLDRSEPDMDSIRYQGPFEVKPKMFEKVVVNAIVVNQKNRKSRVYSANILRRDTLPGSQLAEKKEGLQFSLFKGNFKSVKEIDKATLQFEAGQTKSVSLGQFSKKTNELKDPFGLIFEGFVYAAETAVYEFQLESDDGAVLVVGNREEAVVDIDGPHGRISEKGIVPMSKGYHKIRLKYFQAGGDAALILRWGKKGEGLKTISSSEMAH